MDFDFEYVVVPVGFHSQVPEAQGAPTPIDLMLPNDDLPPDYALSAARSR